MLTTRVIKPTHSRPAPETLQPLQADPALPSYAPEQALAGTLRGVQSDTTPGILDRWQAGFQRLHPAVEFDVYVGGSGQAGPTLTDGSVDFACIARELLPKEEIPFQQKFGYAPLRLAVAGGSYKSLAFTDALTFFVHPDNPLDHLSFSQLDAIFSQSRLRGTPEAITTWGQLGLQGAWHDQPIHLYGVRQQNGFERFLAERVLAGGTWKDTIQVFDTVFPLPGRVAEDPLGISYAGFAYVDNAGVKPLAVAEQDDGPYLTGTFEEVASQRYPLSRTIYLFANQPPGQTLNPLARAFARYTLSLQGQQAVAEDGIFTPLPAELAARERSKIV